MNATMHPVAPLTFDLDASDHIIAVGGSWDEQARRGGAEALSGSGPVGRLLWQYVRGAALRDTYVALFRRARAGPRTLEFGFRCDDEHERRSFTMHVMPLGGESLRVETRLVRAEVRPEALAVIAAGRGHHNAVRCSVCNHYRVGDEWLDVVDAVEQRQLLGSVRPLRLLHGVCPGCLGRLAAVTS